MNKPIETPSRDFLSQTKWEPRNNQLLLKPTVEAEKSSGGIVLPESFRKKMNSGFVVKKGPTADADLQIGDEVFFEPHQEYRIRLDDIDNEEAILVADSHILLRNPFVPASKEIPADPVSKSRPHFPRRANESQAEYDERMFLNENAWWVWVKEKQEFRRRGR